MIPTSQPTRAPTSSCIIEMNEESVIIQEKKELQKQIETLQRLLFNVKQDKYMYYTMILIITVFCIMLSIYILIPV